MNIILKVVDICTRIEGHGSIKIFVQNDDINNVEFELQNYRGFEHFLIKKDLFDIPKIISRLCGLCHISQIIASCKAIEDIYSVKVPKQSILLRKILMTGELIKSHIMHFFFQSLPDLFEIFEIHQNLHNPYELIKYDPQLTTSIYELIKMANTIDQIFGGRAIHTITIIPGGVIYRPSQKDILIAKKYFLKAKDNLEFIIEMFIKKFSKFNPPDEYVLKNSNFIAMQFNGNYDRYHGKIRIKQYRNKEIDIDPQNYMDYFDKDINLRGINFFLKNENNILVGPIARYKTVDLYDLEKVQNYFDAFNKTWKENLLFANFLRLIEMNIEAIQCINYLDDPTLNIRTPLPSFHSIINSEGIGIVDAPRGLLLHHYIVSKENMIKSLKLFIATEINLPLINNMITEYARNLYKKKGDLNLVKEKVKLIIRAFDPCISCATH